MGNTLKALWVSGQTLKRQRTFKSSKRNSEEEHDDEPLKVAQRSCLLFTDLKLTRGDDWAYQDHLSKDPPGLEPAPNPDPDFVKIRRRQLISRIQCLDKVLDCLQGDGILSSSNREAINIYALQKEKKRVLVDLVLRKGEKAEEAFYRSLRRSEPFLLQELQNGPIGEENSPVTSVLKKMLEFLVSDELRTFQWLVGDHVTEEGRPLTVGELLQFADGQTTIKDPQTIEKMRVTLDILVKIVPTLCVCFGGKAVTSKRSCDARMTVNVDTTMVQITPEVFEDGKMFRLRCQQSNVFRCTLTNLQLEGIGDMVYEMIPWNMDFLSSKGLRPAGPLFRFTVLTGRFYRLHLPHCQLVSAGNQHFLSVVHATSDSVEFITPDQVTEGHVIVTVPGFSCFGLVEPAASSNAISGLVLLFREPKENVLFVLLLPGNACLSQVINQWKQRSRVQYLETVPACELIPNQTYRLSGCNTAFIQPESSKFVNMVDYDNFLPSFKVWPTAERVELELQCCLTRLPLIGWLVGSAESVVWHQVIMLRAAASIRNPEELQATTLVLFRVLEHMRSEDLKFFQQLLSLQPDPIPISRLEAADRSRTVDLMVKQYNCEGARQVTEEILRTMNFPQLADELQ